MNKETNTSNCSQAIRQSSGAYLYHIHSNCQGDFSTAASACSSLGGQLAILRDSEIIKTIAESIGYNYSEEALSRTARSSSSGSGSAPAPAPAPVPAPAPAPAPAPDSAPAPASVTTPAPPITTSAPETVVKTFWTGSTVNLPGLDSELFLGGSCGLLSYGENPLSDLPQVNWTLTNDCESVEETYPWICETLYEEYTVGTLIKSEAKETGSVMDYRPSAICLGTSGLAVILAFMTCIVLMDLSRLRRSYILCKKPMKRKIDPGTLSQTASVPVCLDRILDGPVVIADGWIVDNYTMKISQLSANDLHDLTRKPGEHMPPETTRSDLRLQDEGFNSSCSSSEPGSIIGASGSCRDSVHPSLISLSTAASTFESPSSPPYAPLCGSPCAW
ncbi:hypothetical protein PoB_000709300 [Plakobranchus ocellatus]|uniref:C-type lectin domain-containing protein n=1 Tax=Plakobranchus ocellatus TaxID=259542 RepID=A0AAV3YEN5_9GAST|nr:hypothetical protein PoB_000709300 [Plakobranchus ocellatus]